MDSADETSDFRIVSIEMVDGKPKVEWEPHVGFKVVKGFKDFKVVNDFRSPPGWRLSQSAVTRDA